MKRVNFQDYLLGIATTTSARCTCPKRSVGAVIADEFRTIIATGYNGTPRGLPHCDHDCDCGAINLPAPESHQVCLAVHAEVNALLQAGRQARGGTMAITTSPCRECAKAIVNAGIKTIICGDRWRLHDEGIWSPARILEEGGVEIVWRTR